MNGVDPYAFLRTLKPGDNVITRLRPAGPHFVQTVEKVTQTSVTIGGERYRRTNGQMIGPKVWREHQPLLIEWSAEKELELDEALAKQLEAEETSSE